MVPLDDKHSNATYLEYGHLGSKTDTLIWTESDFSKTHQSWSYSKSFHGFLLPPVVVLFCFFFASSSFLNHFSLPNFYLHTYMRA